MTRIIVLDTETTGLSHTQGHRIIEIGCLEMVDRQLTNNAFHQYINPERKIDPGAYKVHGISNDFLKDKPKFAEIMDDFYEFIKGAELVIHNAPFDVGFINAEFHRADPTLGRTETFCNVTDTLQLARKMHPGQKNSLDALCKRYSIDNSNRDLHGALLDSELLAKVYLIMTGGQGNFFNTPNQENDSLATKKHKSQDFSHINLTRKTVSTWESTAHQKYLDELAHTSEKIVWEET